MVVKLLWKTFILAFSNFYSSLNSSKMLLKCFFIPREVSTASSTSCFCPPPVTLGHSSPFLPFPHLSSIFSASPSSSLPQFPLQFSFFLATSPPRCLHYKLLVQLFSSWAGCSWTLPTWVVGGAWKNREEVVMSASLWERHFFLSVLLLNLNKGPDVVMG